MASRDGKECPVRRDRFLGGSCWWPHWVLIPLLVLWTTEAARSQMAPPADSAAAASVPPADRPQPAPLTWHGIRPGDSTWDDVQRLWGTPKSSAPQPPGWQHTFDVGPVRDVRVTIGGAGRVEAIVVPQRQPPTLEAAARALNLAPAAGVMILDDDSRVVGQAFPEHGVLLVLADGEPPRVAHVLLETIQPQPFLLRAETYWRIAAQQALDDTRHVLRLDQRNAAVHWLQARIWLAQGDAARAWEASQEAVRLDPRPEYLVTQAEALLARGQRPEAQALAQRVLEQAQTLPEVRAAAHLVLGRCQETDWRQDTRRAVEHHMQALQIAQQVVNDPRLAVRRAAREVLIEAHLEIAHDIAWGYWKQRQETVDKWLAQAEQLLDDALDPISLPYYRLHVAQRALAALVGLRDQADPRPWVQRAEAGAVALRQTSHDALSQRHASWLLGLALSDAARIHQLRGEADQAIQTGQRALEHLQQGAAQRGEQPAVALALAEAAFRLGNAHAVLRHDHAEAVRWFEQAMPQLARPLPPGAQRQMGHYGQMLVSMAISYWELGDRQRGLELTRDGTKVVEHAVAQQWLPPSALRVPYTNLAKMYEALGDAEQAQRYRDLAAQRSAARP
jgi:tetratricopeptide (TPR) repeat protein